MLPEPQQISEALSKLKSLHWHIVHGTVNREVKEGLYNETLKLLNAKPNDDGA